jgi:hypothetical protein
MYEELRRQLLAATLRTPGESPPGQGSPEEPDLFGEGDAPRQHSARFEIHD